MMEHVELTPEAKQAIADAVREIAFPVPRSWESIVASIVFVIFVFTRPPAVSNGIPYLLDRSYPEMIADFVMLAVCAVCGLSAARNQQFRGRLSSSVMFVISMILIGDWVYFLLT
jgi:hypothetical protein